MVWTFTKVHQVNPVQEALKENLAMKVSPDFVVDLVTWVYPVFVDPRALLEWKAFPA